MKLRNLWYSLLSSLLLSPYLVSAQSGCGTGTLCNPLKSRTIQDLVSALIDIVLLVALPVGVIFIVWGGFRLVTAGGDEKQVESGYKTLIAAVIGIAIVLAAKLLSSVLGNTLDQLQGRL